MRKHEDKASVNVALDELQRELDLARRTKSSTFIGFGATTLATSANDRWLNPLNPGAAASATEVFAPAPRSGTLKSLVVHIGSVGDASDRTVTLSVRRNQLDTPVKVQFVCPKFSGVLQSKAVGAVKVERGELLSVVIRKSNALLTAPGPIIAFVEIE